MNLLTVALVISVGLLSLAIYEVNEALKHLNARVSKVERGLSGHRHKPR